ncbi:MAG TPA: bifunctional 5,10-methylenetetrahydrofolate dehydrogenase/5,10-methenyltetrahydrofolate cyclohydrolase [Gaiellaceae bacterium]|nr:bifunctional 5,10-methylenetetrahydrofolate dehydrogenase/5,10-methenyltetrahydrofolate cyclohydrolase [Gaiellaceae bacterium]
MATLLDGKALAQRIRAEVKEEIAQLGSLGLATILVGDDPANDIYIRRKHEAAQEVGITSTDIRLPEETSEEELLDRIAALNGDDAIDGILVQLPLPEHVSEVRVIRAVEPVKDVDGFHPLNAGQLYLGRPSLVPATPIGIMALLAEYNISLEGAKAVVVGRSDIVGKPVAHLLLQQHATVTICHSRTRDLRRETLEADVLVVAVGRPWLVTADMVKHGASVVDVGLSRTDAGLVGDVDPAAMEVAGHMTPVPGGVGPMTIASLLRNTVLAAKFRANVLAFPPS